MADKAPSFKLGEFRGHCRTEIVELTDTVADGDFLKITGKNDDEILKVAKHTAQTDAYAIVPLQGAGKSGDYRKVIVDAEYIKVTLGHAFRAADIGKQIAVNTNKVVLNTAGTKGNNIGILRTGDASTADGDTGLIKFRGGMNGV